MVTVQLDKERHLRLTLRGMLAFEEKTGINLFQGFDISKLSLHQTTVLIWACLIHEDKKLTFDNFIDIIDLTNINKIADAVAKCIVESVPGKEGDTPLAEKS